MNASYLVAVLGEKHGIIASCYAKSEEAAARAVHAKFLDDTGIDGEAIVIDNEAVPGLWIAADPKYVREVLAA